MFCGHCGAENDERVKFCISCGRLLAEPVDSPPAAPPPVPDDGSPQAYKAPPPGSVPPAPPQGGYIARPSIGGYEQFENTSGMGSGYPMPPETQNMNFAGCLPWGIFAFANGSALWGVITLVATFILGGIANLLLVIKGNEFAWQNRRFSSRQEYNETMTAWNYWGKIWFIFSIVMSFVVVILYFWLIIWAVSQDMGSSYDPTSGI